MNKDTAYITDRGPDLARALQRAGRWDEALAALPAGQRALRAEILTDRFWWRLDDPAEAEAAIAELAAEDRVLAGFYGGQLAYIRLLGGMYQAFGGSGPPRPRAGDHDLALEGFTAAVRDRRLAGWGAFWRGVLADLIEHDPGTAASSYARALALAGEHDDPLLESYAVRHQAGHLMDAGERERGLSLLHRSYYLRAALGARPQTAAAAVTLADALGPGEQTRQLRETAAITARELRLTWLLTEF